MPVYKRCVISCQSGPYGHDRRAQKDVTSSCRHNASQQERPTCLCNYHGMLATCQELGMSIRNKLRSGKYDQNGQPHSDSAVVAERLVVNFQRRLAAQATYSDLGKAHDATRGKARRHHAYAARMITCAHHSGCGPATTSLPLTQKGHVSGQLSV